MKFLPLILFFSILLSSCASNYYGTITKYQSELKEEWDNPHTTPLKEDEKSNFKGITFFPVNDQFRIKAKFTKTENGKTIPFPTSANKIKHYKEYGKIDFQLNRKPFELTIYQSDPPIEGYENSLFIPFTDDTNGITSYGGGRYLDIEIKDIQNNTLILDFNKAYNPYCAYSKYYNCPIPPSNNYLETEITAGVSYIE